MSTIKDFADSGTGTEGLLKDAILLLEDNGAGADNVLTDKITKILESGAGIDILYRNKKFTLTDSGAGADNYKSQYPFPKKMKRIIILIRDVK